MWPVYLIERRNVGDKNITRRNKWDIGVLACLPLCTPRGWPGYPFILFNFRYDTTYRLEGKVKTFWLFYCK